MSQSFKTVEVLINFLLAKNRHENIISKIYNDDTNVTMFFLQYSCIMVIT